MLSCLRAVVSRSQGWAFIKPFDNFLAFPLHEPGDNGLTASLVFGSTSPPRLSIATFTPWPPVQALTRSTKSSLRVLMTKSAPSNFAYSCVSGGRVYSSRHGLSNGQLTPRSPLALFPYSSILFPLMTIGETYE